MENVIYKIEIEGCDRFYIGSAVRFGKRKAHHLSRLRSNNHRNIHLQRIYNKFGEDKLSFSIIEQTDSSETLLEVEQKWIDSYDFSLLINICPTAGNTLGRFHSEETKNKISENHHDVSGKNNPMFGKRGKLSPNYGKKHTEETKEKISKAHKGKVGSWRDKKRPDHAERMTGEGNPFYGKEHDEETKKRISESRRQHLRQRGGKKLTIEVAREIRARYNTGEHTVTALAKEYGLSRTYCGKLIKGVYWNED